MRILVTGAAGFIGSHLCEKLLTNNHQVVGVDSFIGPTPQHLKQENIRNLVSNPKFTFHNVDLLTADLDGLLKDIDTIYHLAGIPGVRASWGKDFDPYVTNNIHVTQRLLEAAKNHPIHKFIFASTSSVYGEMSGKIKEDASLFPLSPYGITKLTGEHLCNVYRNVHGVPIVKLRFFTVYGPRQRPDMAFHRFIKQILKGDPLTAFGDGTQSRDFTYIDDCIDGIEALLDKDHVIGETFNIGGKERATVNEVISTIERLSGEKAKIIYLPKINGEPKHTWADIANATSILDYHPKISLEQGLAREIDYIRSIYSE